MSLYHNKMVLFKKLSIESEGPDRSTTSFLHLENEKTLTKGPLRAAALLPLRGTVRWWSFQPASISLHFGYSVRCSSGNSERGLVHTVRSGAKNQEFTPQPPPPASAPEWKASGHQSN